MVVFETALGPCAIAWSEVGVTRVVLPGGRMPHGCRHADIDDAPPAIRDAIAGIVALMQGEARDLCEVVLDERDIDAFRRRVFARARETGPGETVSYGEIARAIGVPDGGRAVGAALGNNPFAIVVPCHRVVAADGALTGFSAPGGVATKRRMLEIEGAPGFTQTALFA